MENRKYLEIFGVVSVVPSRVFVGKEFQQASEATHSATVLQLKDSWVQLDIVPATSAETGDSL